MTERFPFTKYGATRSCGVVLACGLLLSVEALAQTNTGFAGAAVSIAFQNSTGLAFSAVSVSFRNATTEATGRSVAIGFGSAPSAGALLGKAPHSGSNADPVNTATGNYFFQRTDLSVPGKGLSFQFTRSYNSGCAARGLVGFWLDA